jgi:hypothetical protein
MNVYGSHFKKFRQAILIGIAPTKSTKPLPMECSGCYPENIIMLPNELTPPVQAMEAGEDAKEKALLRHPFVKLHYTHDQELQTSRHQSLFRNWNEGGHSTQPCCPLRSPAEAPGSGETTG